MLERLLRFLAVTLSLIVAVGFVLFAVDDLERASDARRSQISGDPTAVDPTPAGERERERRHGALREAVDDANDVLLGPVAGVAKNADSRWLRRGVPALLGLLACGVVLGFAARYARGHG